MSTGVKPIPDGYSAVTPYLVVEDANKLVEFVKKAFNAQEHHVSRTPDGAVVHAEVRIAGAPIMIGGGRPGGGLSTAMIYIYTTDTDAMYKSAIEAGGTSVMAPADQFYGDRNAGVKDFAGNQWWIATHVEDVAPEELEKRMKVVMQQRAAQKS